MRKTLVTLLVLVAVASYVAGRLSVAGEPGDEKASETVKAQRYLVLWADSALDLSHGGGRQVTEVFFPDRKLAACVVHETFLSREEEGEGGRFETRARLYVNRTERARNDLTGFTGQDPNPPSEIQEIDVSAALACRIVGFADLADRYDREGRSLGADLAGHLGLSESAPAVGPQPR